MTNYKEDKHLNNEAIGPEVKPFKDTRRSQVYAYPADSIASNSLQLGAHTAWFLPAILRETICARMRCLPQSKHDIVA